MYHPQPERLSYCTYACFLCGTFRGHLRTLSQCGISDEDAESGLLAACLDAAGRENIVELNLSVNDLTTLPSDIFDSLTGLIEL